MADPPVAEQAGTADLSSDTTNDEPAETAKDLAAEVERWKSLSRKNEEHAKANADAAARLKQLEDANKTELERQAETLTALRHERDEALVEAARLRAAVKYGLRDEHLKFLGTGAPDEIEALAADLAARLNLTGQPRKPGPDPTQGSAADPNTSTAAQFAAAISGL